MNSNYVYNDPLAVIYNESHWLLNKMTPMYHLQYDTVKLKQYALKIREAIVSDIATNSEFKVIFEELPMLKYSEEDPNPIMITVTLKSSASTSFDKKTVYCAILMSWGVGIPLDDSIHLPYMLERGEKKVGTVVKSSLGSLFDCEITEYNFTQYQLLQFCFKLVENDNSKATDALILSYGCGEHKFTVTFEIGDIHIIWNPIKNGIQPKNQYEYESVMFAYQLLQNHVCDNFGINTATCDLQGVTLPKAEIRNNGYVKIKTPELLNTMFTVLNKITNILHLDLD